jgi:hypothetical protein
VATQGYLIELRVNVLDENGKPVGGRESNKKENEWNCTQRENVCQVCGGQSSSRENEVAGEEGIRWHVVQKKRT